MDLSNDDRQFAAESDLRKFRRLQLHYMAMNVALGRIEVYDLIPVLSLARQEGLSGFDAGLIVKNAFQMQPRAAVEVLAA